MLKLWIAVIELGPARKEPDSFFTTRHMTCQKTIRVCETFTISYLFNLRTGLGNYAGTYIGFGVRKPGVGAIFIGLSAYWYGGINSFIMTFLVRIYPVRWWAASIPEARKNAKSTTETERRHTDKYLMSAATSIDRHRRRSTTKSSRTTSYTVHAHLQWPIFHRSLHLDSRAGL